MNNLKPKISTRIICQIALLIALAFVLERLIPLLFPWVNLGYARLTFTFIPMMCCGMLYGPVWGAAAYITADILGWVIMQQPPIPLILLSRAVSGLIFGFALYRKDLKFFPHAFLAAFSEPIICGAGIVTLGLSLPPSYYAGMSYYELLYIRLPFIVAYIVLQLAVFPALVRFRTALHKSGVVLQ